MPEGFEIDLDGEQVLFDGTWYSKEELARKVRGMVDSGDYRVARPSSALESLQNGLLNLRTLTVRLPAELAEALASAAARAGKPVGALVRESLAHALPQPQLLPPPLRPLTMQAPVTQPSTVTEPVTADEAASAIPLTPKIPKPDPNDPEKNWFNRRK